MDKETEITTAQAAQLIGIERGSFKVAMTRYNLAPLRFVRGIGNVWNRTDVEAVAKVYFVNKVAHNINPKWRKPFFTTKTRRPRLTAAEHQQAIAKARIALEQASLDAKKERQSS